MTEQEYEEIRSQLQELRRLWAAFQKTKTELDYTAYTVYYSKVNFIPGFHLGELSHYVKGYQSLDEMMENYVYHILSGRN